jgi:ubiquinone/menaquinone biosynthesis C-methylase UbiE
VPLSLDKQNAYRARYAAAHPGWQPATARYESLIRAHLQPGMHVLDLGCGRGGALEQLGAAVSHPLGLDPDLRSLVEHRLPGLPRMVAPADAIPLRATSVDMVLSSWVLEHLPDPARTFREVARVLRSGGVFVFLTPGANSPAALLNRALYPFQALLVPLVYGRAEVDAFPMVYRANTPRQIDRLARDAGLTCASLHTIHDPTYFAFHPLIFRFNAALAGLLPDRMAEHLAGVCTK